MVSGSANQANSRTFLSQLPNFNSHLNLNHVYSNTNEIGRLNSNSVFKEVDFNYPNQNTNKTKLVVDTSDFTKQLYRNLQEIKDINSKKSNF